ncbi:hypothetical protein J3458_018241 [Metarhizium acridum]|uniref:uncharacterized protein n=1 Tax=Metarhizium acridum TaxID=92637 RepID=UPI001C6B80A3|nr:hypothetical protein J3458_018241 [Metarhizium acridum]
MWMIRAIDGSLADAMEADDQRGATGQWVGLLGFSQGAKMAASLLFREQYRMERQGWVRTYQEQLAAALGQRSMFRFAVLLAGRGPLVTLDEDFTAFYGPEKDIWEPILQLPTVHVHGTQDDGLAMHRDFRNRCCTEESTTLVEWNGNHRVPIKAVHVSAVISALMKAYQQSQTL